MARKLTKKQIVKQDVVKSTIVSFWEDLQAHPIRFTAIVVLFIGLLIVTLAWRYYSVNKYENASALMTKVLAEFGEPEQNAIPGNQEQSSDVSLDKKYQELEKDLDTIVRDFPNSAFAPQAFYFRGVIQMRQGHFDESIASFQQSMTSMKDSVTPYLAKFCLGRAYSKKSSYGEAAKIFKELIDDQNSPVPKDYIYWEIALMYQAQGNQNESKMMLQKIITEFPVSPLKSQVEAQLKIL
jgi:TolA-binding protein